MSPEIVYLHQGQGLAIQMAEQDQTKYSYKFSLAAGRIGAMPVAPKEEPERSELQAYINEVLGLHAKSGDKNRLPY